MHDPEILLPAGASLDAMQAADNLLPFGDLQKEFASALSRALTQSAKTRAYPELVALGFWLRPANLRRLMGQFRDSEPQALWQPRGLCFHVAPGNVDTIFVYSWMISLLCGNRSVVRLSTRAGEQSTLLLQELGALLEQPQWSEIARRLLVVRYGHDDVITRRLSASCDVRVIWGGDAAISAIRALPLPPTATEFCFPDKFSLSVLDAAAVAALAEDELRALSHAFAADAYSFGQMACSSPRLVLWRGDRPSIENAQRRFWPLVEQRARQLEHGLTPADFMNKRVALDVLAIDQRVSIAPGGNLLNRVWLEHPQVLAEAHCGAGLFHEASIADLADLLPLASRRVQTVSQFGVSRQEWHDLLATSLPAGIDRVVPVGQALQFSPTWDGQDLWRAFLRQTVLQVA